MVQRAQKAWRLIAIVGVRLKPELSSCDDAQCPHPPIRKLRGTVMRSVGQLPLPDVRMATATIKIMKEENPWRLDQSCFQSL